MTDTDNTNVAYDDLSTDEQELYDAVEAKLGEKWSHEEVMTFLDELDDIGITTAEESEDSLS